MQARTPREHNAKTREEGSTIPRYHLPAPSRPLTCADTMSFRFKNKQGRNAMRWLEARIALAALALALSATAAPAQYPNRLIKIISPAPPGGGTDIAARLVQPGLQDLLKQTVIVESRGGAGGYIGTE